MPANPVPTDPVGIFKLLRASRPADHIWTNEDYVSIGLPPPFMDGETWRARLAKSAAGGAIETPPAKSNGEQAGASQVKVDGGVPGSSAGQHLEEPTSQPEPPSFGREGDVLAAPGVLQSPDCDPTRSSLPLPPNTSRG